MTGSREIVQAPGAPAAIGPYSHAVRAGGLLVCSGQIPLDPPTGELVGRTPAAQARRCMENLSAVCEAAGTTLAQARGADDDLYDRPGDLHRGQRGLRWFFGDEPPARVTVGVAQLPKGAQVEIDAVVAL